MIVPECFHYINSSLCFLVGVPLNALLLWLIVNRSPSEMRQYRRVLLLASLVDIVYLAVFLAVMPVMAVKDNLATMFSLGPFGSLPNPWGFTMVMTWLFLNCYCMFSLAVPFVYRYYVICRGKNWGLREFLALLLGNLILVPAICCAEHVCLCYFSGYVHSERVELAANEHFGFPADSNRTYVLPLFSASRALINVTSANIAFFAGVNYIFIAIFGRQLYRHLNAIAVEHLSQKRSRVLNRQISMALIIQAVVPLVVEFLPTVQLASTIAFGQNFGDSSLYMTAAYAWIPVLNPLATMWVVRAYRQQLLAWAGHVCGNVAASISMPETDVVPNAPLRMTLSAIGKETDEREREACA